MLNSLFSYERSTRPLSSVALSSSKVSSISAFCAFSTLVMSLLLASSVTGQTIWEENFTGESDSATGAGGITLTGDQWSATTTSSISSTLDVGGGDFSWSTANDGTGNASYSCTWTSDPIDAAGYTNLQVAMTTAGDGSVTSTVSGAVGSTVITIVITMGKNDAHTLELIRLTGTSSCTPTTWYADADGDGLGDSNTSQSACDQPDDYVADSSDSCDNTLACNYAEVGNPACTYPSLWYADTDGDGFGNPASSQTSCSQPAGYTADDSDCDDSDSNVTTATTTWYEDADGDGLGDPAVSQTACSQPAGYVDNNTDDDPNLNPSDYSGTILSPGDVYFSFAAEEFGNVEESYIGFTFLKDVAEGTKLVVSPSLAWSSNQWNVQDNSSTTAGIQWTAIQWTAPAGGVSAGTEVILFDIQKDVIGGDAYCDEASNPIVRSVDTFTLTGGQAAGSYVHKGPNNDYFTWNTPVSWMFQPDDAWGENAMGSSANDGKCRHLHCVGYALDNASNSGTGTLIEGTSWDSQLDPAYSFEDPLFSLSSAWKYNGGASANAFTSATDAIVTQSLSSAVSFSAANGATPSYTSTSTSDQTDYSDYDLIPFDPNGSIAIATQATWDNLANTQGIVNPSGNSSLDIFVDNGVSLVVDASSEVACKDITVTTGTFQSCDGNARTVAVSGNIALGTSATFEGGQGTVKLSGLTAQTIDANNYADPSSSRFQLKNLVVENNKTATLKGHIKLKPAGALKFDSGAQTDKLKIDSSVSSSLTFQSTGSGTAAIGPCEASNFEDGTSQEFTFERFVPADTDNSWVNIAPYVTGTTAANWTDSIAGALIFKYVETSYGSLAAGWQYVWNSSEVLTPGTGYMALIPANTSGTFSVTGTFQMGDVDIALTFTDDLNQSNSAVDGWNLVANPYPAPVNLPQVLADNDLVESYYIFDNTGSGSYRETLDDGSGDAPTILDVGQSFWVKVTQATTITFSESDKVVDGSNTFLREFDPGFEGSLGLHVENVEDQWSNAFISFHEEATPDFNHEEDAVHLDTELLNQLRMWTVAETGEHLAIQSLGSVATTPSVPLHMTTGAGGEITFELFEQDLMPENYCMVVEDTETGEKAQMGVETLTVSVPAETLYEGRFVLHFNAMPAMELTSTTCDGLDIAELEGDWDAWDVAWESTDGEMSGDGFPYDLPNGEYVFTYANGLSGCANAIPASVQDACLGDFNANGTRDITDLMVLLAGMPGSGGASVLGADVADCNCDGLVTIEDILTFLSVFSSACEE